MVYGAAWQKRTVNSVITLGVIGLLLQGILVVNASTLASDGNTSFRAHVTFIDDGGIVVSPKGIQKISSTIPARGDTAPGVEATSALPPANNALTANHYAYYFDVKEAVTDSLQSGAGLKIEVYAHYGGYTDLLATLYVEQTTVDDANVEGVTAIIDVGSSNSIPDRFDIIVTRL